MSVPKSNMRYVRLGKSGLKVSKIILGTMQYGSTDWASWVLPEEEAIKHIKFADQAAGLPREELVIMTKVYFATPYEPAQSLFRKGLTPGDVGIINQHGLNRKHIFDSVKASLKRLQLDYVDVLQCHRFDYETPIEETMRALDDLVKAGYVRYLGMSSCHAYQYAECVPILSLMPNLSLWLTPRANAAYALAHNLTPFISMQNHYNLAYREEERDMFPTLAQLGVGAIPWSPLARGLLTRPAAAAAQTTRGQGDWYMPYKKSTTDVITKVEELSKRKGVSMAQIAVAWMLSKPGVTAPIVGTTSLANLEDILGGLDVQLTEEEIKELEAPYRPQPIMGHD
uniref:Cell surface hydrophobicity-associated protein n=1 Tax=Ganoderma boninense TaxID=34458 RepID=A0A5K1K6Q8_9APHY